MTEGWQTNMSQAARHARQAQGSSTENYSYTTVYYHSTDYRRTGEGLLLLLRPELIRAILSAFLPRLGLCKCVSHLVAGMRPLAQQDSADAAPADALQTQDP
jgi:hypothetical protein